MIVELHENLHGNEVVHSLFHYSGGMFKLCSLFLDAGIKKQLHLLHQKELEQAKTEQKMCQAMFAPTNS